MTTFPFGYHEALALDQIHESPWNPRKTFDPVKMLELERSLKEKGCLTPLVARQRKAGGVEIAAGHRRRRAAVGAGLPFLPVVVKALSDTEFLEVLVVENDQREDVHPLEQAEGYKRLMLQKAEDGGGYSTKRIAERIGRSEKFVYDRMRLLALIPLAQQLFLADKMTAGHAILLARLTPEQQGLAIGKGEEDDRYHTGLFQAEGAGADLFEEDKPRPKGPLAAYEDMKPVSVRELDHWIAEHVRFDPKKADPFLFPAVVTAVTEAPKALVPITHNSYVQDEARDGKVRTYGPASWKDATKKACQYAQGAVIVVGEGRGDVLQVCLSSHRDQCAVHWSKEKKDAEARRKQLGRSGTPAPAKTEEARKKEQLKEERERIVQEETDKRVAAQVLDKVSWPLSRSSVEFCVRTFAETFYMDNVEMVSERLAGGLHKPEKLTPRDLAQGLVALALGALIEERAGMKGPAKLFKIDRLNIEKAVTAELKVQEEGEEPGTAKPKPAKVQASAKKKKAAKR